MEGLLVLDVSAILPGVEADDNPRPLPATTS